MHDLAAAIRSGEFTWEELSIDDADIRLKWAGLFHRRKRNPGTFMMRIKVTLCYVRCVVFVLLFIGLPCVVFTCLFIFVVVVFLPFLCTSKYCASSSSVGSININRNSSSSSGSSGSSSGSSSGGSSSSSSSSSIVVVVVVVVVVVL